MQALLPPVLKRLGGLPEVASPSGHSGAKVVRQATYEVAVMAEELLQRIIPQPRLQIYAQQLDFISHGREVATLLLELPLELLAGVLGGAGRRQRHPQVSAGSVHERHGACSG